MSLLSQRESSKHDAKTHSHGVASCFRTIASQAVNVTRLAEPTFVVQIEGLDLHHPPKIGWAHRYFYVDISVDSDTQTTSDACAHHLPWKERFQFNAHDRSIIELKVFARRSYHQDVHIGTLLGTVDSFLAHRAGIYRILSTPLSNVEQDNSRQPAVSFCVRRIEQVMPIEYSILHRDEFSVTTFSPLLEKINIFLSLVDQFADIHPYVKIASITLSTALKIVAAKIIIAKGIEDLIHAITDAYSFVSEAKPLENIRSNHGVIRLLSQQTAECGYFIRDVMKEGKFGQYIAAANMEIKVQHYKAKFVELKRALQERITIQIGDSVLRLHDEVHAIRSKMDLAAMAYADGAKYQNVEHHKDDLEPNQQRLFDEIVDWISGETTQRILFLCGTKGSGKTVLAWKVAKSFDSLKRLGSSYFIHANDDMQTAHALQLREPTNLFSTIARDLADYDTQFQNALCNAVQKRADQVQLNMRGQFEKFILLPAQKMDMCGPTVIVIDGLDFCGDATSRQTLLDVLATTASQLPPNFRMLITSRPQPDICDALRHREHVLEKLIGHPVNDSGVFRESGHARASTAPSCPPCADTELPEWHKPLAEQNASQCHYQNEKTTLSSSMTVSPSGGPSKHKHTSYALPTGKGSNTAGCSCLDSPQKNT